MKFPEWMRQSISHLYQSFVFLFSLATAIYATMAVWVIYSYSHSAFLVSVMIVLGYMPAAIVGIFFSSIADQGQPVLKLHAGNGVMILCALALLAAVVIQHDFPVATVILVGASQVLLSLVRMFNQSGVAVLLRKLFDKDNGAKMMQLSASNSLIAQAIGTCLAGLMLNTRWLFIGIILSIVLYLISSAILHRLPRGESLSSPSAKSSHDDYSGMTQPFWRDRTLLSLLFFSVPSSGALQFQAALLAPLAGRVMEDSPGYFSLLNILCMMGGFLAGMMLSSGRIPAKLVLNAALPVIALCSAILSISSHPLVIGALSFFLALITTAHIICMQVKTNQVPDEANVARYAVMRNASGAISKSSFSLLAGGLASLVGLSVSLHVLACLLLLFSGFWFLFKPEWKSDLSHVVA